MAVTLTTSYQRISTISLSYGEIRTYAKYNSQSTTGNTTSYSIKSTYYTSQSYLSFSSATSTLDGTSKGYGYTTIYKGETTLQELTRTLNHNTDGSSPTKTINTSWTASYGGNGSTSGQIVAPKIKRVANVSNGTDFNDESNPTLTFTNYANFPLGPYLNFYKNGSVVKRLDREIGAYSSPYTWEITDEEREELRQLFNDGQQFTVTEGFDTYSGNTNIGYSSVSRTFSITNAIPTFTYTTEEVNQKVVNVLGNSSAETLIKNASIVKIVVNPSTYKYATVSNVTVSHGGLIYTKSTAPYEFEIPVVDSNFEISITDSRKYITSETITRNLIDYQAVRINSFNFKRENPTSSNIYVNLDGVYYQANFNRTDNVPTVKWKLNEGTSNLFPSDELYPSEDLYLEDGWITIPSEYYTIDTEKNQLIIYNCELLNILPYTEEGRLSISIGDLLTEATDSMLVIRGIPVMDWGEHDVQVNGDLYLADTNRENRLNINEYFKPKVIASYEFESASNSYTFYDLSLVPGKIYKYKVIGNSTSAQDMGLTINNMSTGYCQQCLYTKATNTTGDVNVTLNSIYRANKTSFYAGMQMTPEPSVIEGTIQLIKNPSHNNYYIPILSWENYSIWSGYQRMSFGQGTHSTETNEITTLSFTLEGNANFMVGTKIEIIEVTNGFTI